MPDFKLNSELTISRSFKELGFHCFSEAITYVKNLPYSRNSNREDFLLVLRENKGTCSSKHALLKSLADENNHPEVKLMLGIFKMNEVNTPKVKKVLEKFGLKYIPEAHNYLKINHKIYDCTTISSSEINFVNDLILEAEIQPCQVSESKIEFHQNFLKQWIADKPFSSEEIWAIREQCIYALSSNSK